MSQRPLPDDGFFEIPVDKAQLDAFLAQFKAIVDKDFSLLSTNYDQVHTQLDNERRLHAAKSHKFNSRLDAFNCQEKANNDLEERLKALEEELTATKSNHKARNDTVNDCNRKLTEDNDVQQRQKKELTAKEDELQDDNQKLQKEKTTIHDQIKETTKAIGQTTTERDSALGYVKSNQGMYEKRKQELQSHNDFHQGIHTRKVAAPRDLTMQVAQSTDEYQKSLESQLKYKQIQFEFDCDTTTRDNTQKQNELDQLVKSNAVFENELKVAEAALPLRQQAYKANEDKLNKMNDSIGEKNAQLETIKADSAKKEGEIAKKVKADADAKKKAEEDEVKKKAEEDAKKNEVPTPAPVPTPA